jgi:membrane associated rhomboid family serine protease
MFPIGDINPVFSPPWVTRGLVVTNIVVFALELFLGIALIVTLSFVPAELSALLLGSGDASVLRDLFTAMFLHASVAHIFGNMLFLWIFGDNVEESLAWGWFLPFYLACGLVASLVQYATAPLSEVPMVGASGAISGVLGAYLVLFPRVKVRVFIWPFSLFIGTLNVPAAFWIGLWFVMQLFGGIEDLGRVSQGGVAFWAHIGGFLAGLFLVMVLPRRRIRPHAET